MCVRHGSGRSATRDECRAQLFQMMWHVLSRHAAPDTQARLHYYQGYHDVSSVLLLLAGESAGTMMLEVRLLGCVCSAGRSAHFLSSHLKFVSCICALIFRMKF